MGEYGNFTEILIFFKCDDIYFICELSLSCQLPKTQHLIIPQAALGCFPQLELVAVLDPLMQLKTRK